jgi:hypothetical protein
MYDQRFLDDPNRFLAPCPEVGLTEVDVLTSTKDTYLMSKNGNMDSVLYLKDKKKGAAKASVHLFTVPYCCGTLFLANLRGYIPKQGSARKLLNLVTHYAEISGYACIQCVVPDDGYGSYDRAFSVFKAAGFEILKGSKFKNFRTGNNLYTLQKNVKVFTLNERIGIDWYHGTKNLQPVKQVKEAA